MLKLVFEKAKAEQVQAICELVNLAYRGDAGWTKESDIISGNRTHADEVSGFLANDKAHLLVARLGGEIAACICIEQDNDLAHIGFFAVHPKHQGQGVGSQALTQAEDYAANRLKAKAYAMRVVSGRSELIAYYQRWGYKRTGEIEPYPKDENVGVPKVEGLMVERLVKVG